MRGRVFILVCLQFCTLFYLAVLLLLLLLSLQICKLITVNGQTGASVLAPTRLAIALVVSIEQETARTPRPGHQSIANIAEETTCRWIHVSCPVCTTVRLYIVKLAIFNNFSYSIYFRVCSLT